MLIKLQFDSTDYDIIDVPAKIMDYYNENSGDFYDRLYDWLREKGEPFYCRGCYSYAEVEIIEWINSELLKDTEEKVKIVEQRRIDSAYDNLPIMSF